MLTPGETQWVLVMYPQTIGLFKANSHKRRTVLTSRERVSGCKAFAASIGHVLTVASSRPRQGWPCQEWLIPVKVSDSSVGNDEWGE
jgi:hypothetical protein